MSEWSSAIPGDTVLFHRTSDGQDETVTFDRMIDDLQQQRRFIERLIGAVTDAGMVIVEDDGVMVIVAREDDDE